MLERVCRQGRRSSFLIAPKDSVQSLDGSIKCGSFAGRLGGLDLRGLIDSNESMAESLPSFANREYTM